MTERPDARATPEEVVVEDDRGLLLNVAYRLLGSLADAEDAVQDAYLRWYRLSPRQRGEIVSPTAWLVRVTSRVCLDRLGSAPRRREHYVGEWLPEPIPDAGRWSTQRSAEGTDPADRITLDESVSMALLVVLESMTPAERVAFVLHDVFRHPYDEIADVLGRSPAACRQLAASARRRVRSGVARSSAPDAHADVVAAFTSAWESGDLAGLVALLDPAVVAVADGGGVVSAAVEPVHGAERVARFLLDVLVRRPDVRLEPSTVNGGPGLVARSAANAAAVISFGFRGAPVDRGSDRVRVDRIWVVRNPAKLTAWVTGR